VTIAATSDTMKLYLLNAAGPTLNGDSSVSPVLLRSCQMYLLPRLVCLRLVADMSASRRGILCVAFSNVCFCCRLRLHIRSYSPAIERVGDQEDGASRY